MKNIIDPKRLTNGEKSKIRELYECYREQGIEAGMKGLREELLIVKGSTNAMRIIFGAEMFY